MSKHCSVNNKLALSRDVILESSKSKYRSWLSAVMRKLKVGWFPFKKGTYTKVAVNIKINTHSLTYLSILLTFPASKFDQWSQTRRFGPLHQLFKNVDYFWIIELVLGYRICSYILYEKGNVIFDVIKRVCEEQYW